MIREDKTRLTVFINPKLIRQAKFEALRRNISVSQLVCDLLDQATDGEPEEHEK